VDEPRSFSALTLEGGTAPELAYVTAKFAALAPFAKVANLLAELLPVGGAVNAGTVRNRTRVSASVSRGCDPRVLQIPTLMRDPCSRSRPRWRLSAQRHRRLNGISK